MAEINTVMDETFAEKFKQLHDEILEHELMQRSTPLEVCAKPTSLRELGLGAMKATLPDIQASIIKSQLDVDIKDAPTAAFYYNYRKTEKFVSPYIKITLKKTNNILLYEQRSVTALRDTDEGQLVEEDNKRYEYLTEGKGSRRTRVQAETQTTRLLYKSRSINTESIVKESVGSYVSNFEMFDTYMDLEKSTKSVDVDGAKRIDITTYKVDGVDRFIEINAKPSFRQAVMITMRILAGNVYEPQQRRFRNMEFPDPLAPEVCYKYRLELLWRFSTHAQDERLHSAVSDLCWCPCNGDILAASYGFYSYPDKKTSRRGYVCIWNIKNPVNPERFYAYNVPVMSVEFSPHVPQLLAIGLYDGSVEVRDISNADYPPIAVSHRSTSPSCEPVSAIQWIQQPNGCNENTHIVQPFLALSQNGSVTKYHIVNSPHLLGQPQIRLDRIEGCAEGLPVESELLQSQSNRHPQGINLSLNPQHADIFYVMTDEGCLHQCSTFSTHQHVGVTRMHETGINYMEFSPWSPKLYLTCGNDWCVHIWIEDIFQPLITLRNQMNPVHCAYWSKTHSTIIVALTRKSIDVWDIRISTLKPISSTMIDKHYHTLCKQSNCGRSVAVGNEAGTILLIALEDMPFPPYYQYNELKAALFKAIVCDDELKSKLKSCGYFGYPQQHHQQKTKASKS